MDKTDLTKILLKNEEELLSKILDVDSKSWPLSLREKPVGAENLDSDFQHYTRQLARLGSALIIGLNLMRYEVDVSILDVRAMNYFSKHHDVISLIKDFCAWPLAVMQDVPEPPNSWGYEYLFGSRIRHFIRGRILNPNTTVRRSGENFVLGELFLRLKRCSLEVTPDYILKSLEKHSKALGQCDIDQELDCDSENRVYDWIDRVLDEIVPDGVEGLPLVEPGQGAGYDAPRKWGGAFGALAYQRSGGRLPIGGYVLGWMVWNPRGGLTSVWVPAKAIEEVFPFFEMDEERADYINDLVMKDEPIKCQAIAVLEPLKVRVITKGDVHAYHESRRLQILLTRWMKNCSIKHFFPALRGKIDQKIVDDLQLQRMIYENDYSRMGGFWLSGDYKGATDTLKRSMSEYVIRSIVKRIPSLWASPLGEIMRKTLVDHDIEYHWSNGLRGEEERVESWSVRQRTGQLMGSFLSFPVLNIINLAIHLAWFDLHRSQWDAETMTLRSVSVLGRRRLHAAGQYAVWRSHLWKHTPVIVNGDDVLALSSKNIFGSEWERWILASAGFVKSQGKNYVSREFCTINSTLFVCDGEGLMAERGCPRVESLYNQAWCTKSQPKGKGAHLPMKARRDTEEYLVGPQMVGSVVKDLTERCGEMRGFGVNLFIQKWMKELAETGRSWFLPAELGGLGLPCYPEMEDFWKKDALLTSYILRLQNTQEHPETLSIQKGQVGIREIDLLAREANRRYTDARGYVQRFVVDPKPELLELDLKGPFVAWQFLDTPEMSDISPEVTGKNILKDTQLVAKWRVCAERTKLSPFRLDEHIIRSVCIPYGVQNETHV